MKEPGRLQSMGSLRVGHDWVASLSLFTFMHWRRRWQPTPVFLPGGSQGRGSLVGSQFRTPQFRTQSLWNHRVRHDWSNLAAVAAARPTWLHIPRCLALGEWSHHCDYLGHEDLFLYSSSVYSCHFFLVSSVSVRSIPFLSFIVPIFAWNVPLVSLIFLKRSLLLLLSHFNRVRLCATP